MKQFNIILSAALGLTLFASVDLQAETEGEVTIGGRYIHVEEDQGRFREDHYLSDKVTGSDRLWFRSTEGDNVFEMDLELRMEDEYRLDALYSREDIGYIKLDIQTDRRYHDGSNEAWDPSEYGLTGNEVIPDNRTTPPGLVDDGFYKTEHFADRPDGDLYTERIDINVEAGLTIPDAPEVIIGWHRWQRKGDELLLRSERARVTNPNDSKNGEFFPRSRSIPAIAHIDGISDLLYLEIAASFLDTHNVRIRQEYETYKDSQVLEFPRYLWNQAMPSAEIEQYRMFEDEPEFENLVSLLTYDGQFGENTFVGAGYTYGDLENTSTRSVIRPNRGKPSQVYHTVDPVSTSERVSHVGMGGFRQDALFGVEGLDVIAGVRVEEADTASDTAVLAGGTTPRLSSTDLNETRIEEDIELVYAGIESTVVSVEVELEQRDLAWREYVDVGSHEIFGATHFNSGIQFFDFAQDIDHQNEEYTVKVVNRSLPQCRLTGKYSKKSRERDTTVLRDSDPRFFPGRMGGYDIEGDEIAVSINRRVLNAYSCVLKYQYLQEDISTDFAQGETQDWEIHRVSASLAGSVIDRLFVLSSLIYEQYAMDTPVNITDPASNWAPGTEAYDYDGDYATLLINGDCAITETVSAQADYQLTSSMGNNEYVYHKASAGVVIKATEDSTIKLAYEVYDFQDKEGNGFDDYSADGASASYTLAF